MAEILAFLTEKGFAQESEGRGKHGVKMVKGKLRIPIPSHKGDVPKGTLLKILKKAGFNGDDVIAWRRD